MNYISFIPETCVDGDGMRASLYVSGCSHKCKGCHNPSTWDYNAGEKLTEKKMDEIIDYIKSNPLLSGITISGGDPLAEQNRQDLCVFLKKLKENNINVWVYTGYYYYQVKNIECMKYIDVLVDGPFVESMKNPELQYRGSSNQSVIRFRKLLQD